MANTNGVEIPSPLNWNNAYNAQDSRQAPLGTKWDDLDPVLGRREFVFVRLDASSNIPTVGSVVLFKDNYGTVATTKQSDSAYNLVAGVTQSALTPGSCGWIQKKGYHSGVLANGDTFAKGDNLQVIGSTDVVVGVKAAGSALTTAQVGVALGASTGSPLMVPAILKIS